MKLSQQKIEKAYIDNLKNNYPFSFEHSGIIQDNYIEVFSRYQGEIRFGPPYFNISVYDQDTEIWSGGNSIYGGELFCKNILCTRLNKLVLVKWFSLIDPRKQNIVIIDLKNGKETEMFDLGRYWWAGHFNSFDAIFYHKNNVNDILCYDLELKTQFSFNERVKGKIPNLLSWGISTIENTIIVFTNSIKDNVILYNIRKKEILEKTTIPLELSKNGRIDSFLDKDSCKLIVQLSDYDLGKENNIINQSIKYELLELNQ